MQYTLSNVEKVKHDWIKASIKGLDGISHDSVSINKTDKKGDLAFKDFNSFTEGTQIEADYWESPKGGKYLFAPKPRAVGAPRAAGGVNIAKAQAVKAENIERAQERKHDAITLAGAMRDGCAIAIRELNDMPFPSEDDFKKRYKYWIDFILQQHDILKDRPF